MIKILIVEDDPSTLKLLKKLINDIGYVDILAGSAELAHEILKVNKDIDLLVTDVVLEEMSGLDLVKIVREDDHFKELPIVVCSGMISKDEIMSFLNEGIQLFMEKPINGKKFQGHVLKLLEPVLEETRFL